MPGGDRTGPAGMGSMTGRGAGVCAGYSVPGCMNSSVGRVYQGRGLGKGFGRGRGFGRGIGAHGLTAWNGVVDAYPPVDPFASSLTPEQELINLKGHAKYLNDTLDGIKKQIEKLENKNNK